MNANIISCHKHTHNGGASIDVSAEIDSEFITPIVSMDVSSFTTSCESKITGFSIDDIEQIGQAFIKAAEKMRKIAEERKLKEGDMGDELDIR